MLNIDILQDEDLQSAVNTFISGLLPHSNYNAECFSQNLSVLLSYVEYNEFQMEYRMLIGALMNLNNLKVSMPMYEPSLRREQLDALLEVSLGDAVVQPEVGMINFLKYEGNNSNLDIETVREEACQILYTRTMELYDTCFALEIPSDDVLNYEPVLKEAFIAHVGSSCINTQAEIVKHSARIGRKKYTGFEDWISYTTHAMAEIKDRISNANADSITVLNSSSASTKLLDKMRELFIPIANYGIPEIDAYTPILRHRMVVVVGKENIGKTKFAVDKAVNVLLAGGKVAYMCGETAQSKLYCDILINYVFKKYDIVLRPSDILGSSECPDDIQKVIGMSINELIDEGNLLLCDAFSYDTVYDEMVSLYDLHEVDMFVIDHSCALTGSVGDGSLKDKIDHLSSAVRDFRKAYPVCVMVTSHPSTTAKASDSRGRITDDSPTKGSQNLSTDADEVFILRDNETLRKQNLIMLENTKRRDAGRINDYIILKKKFEVSAFIYDEQEQAADMKLTVERDEAIALLENSYSDEGNYTL